MSKSDEKHTPTPWSCKYMFQGSHTPKRADIKGPPGHREVAAVYWHVVDSDHETALANAAFIVRAVNSHAALVEALEDVLSLYFAASQTPDMNFVNKARAALTLAKGA